MILRRRHHSFLPVLVFVLVATDLGVAARAVPQETPPETFEETVEVDLINVEVRVLDKQGDLVQGLTAGDFQVFQDGELVPISNFSEFRDGIAVPTDGGGSTPNQGRGVIAADHYLTVYFDDLHLQATHRGVLIEAVEGFIATERIPAANIMILRQVRELNIEAPFGSSQRDLQKALRDLRKAPPGLSTDVATRQALDDIQRTWNQSRDTTGSGEQGMAQIPGADIGGGPGGTGGSSPRDITGGSGSLSSGNVSSACDIFESRVEAILNSWMQLRSSQISVTLASLGDSATYLAGLPGTKSLLYLSDALETMPGQALSNYADTICPGGEQNLGMNSLGEELGSAFMALTRHAAANRVTIYSLQGGGLQVSSSGSARDRGVRAGSIGSFEATRRAGDQSGLITLAEETGGRASMNMNDYSVALEELGTEMLNYYSLAYQPTVGESRAEHKIEVRLREQGLKARYRRGYVQKSLNQRFSESLQGALFLGLVDNPLQARLAADEFRAGAEGLMTMPLRVVLPVDLVSFIPEGDQLMASILVRIVSRNLETGQTGTADSPFKVKHQPGSGGEWMQLPVNLQLMPGSHIVAVGVLDQESGVTSLVSTTIEVPSS